MRVKHLFLAVFAPLGCATDLDPEVAPSLSAPPLPELVGCTPLPGARGRITAVTLPDERELLVAADDAFELGEGECAEDATPLPARPFIDVSTHGEGLVGTARASFVTDTTYVYFSLDHPGGFDSEGAGIARFDDAAGAFVSLGLLWTNDRPSYGAGAVVEGDFVYVYGGLPARFLAADVYLARAPLARASEPAAYEYFFGGGDWGGDADLATPIAEGGTTPSVMWHASSRRYLMAYATPLTREITLRSGLGPSGPWSRPLALGACSLSFEGAFCGDVAWLPSLAGEEDLALSHTVYTFDATTNDLSSQLVRGPLPADLP